MKTPDKKVFSRLLRLLLTLAVLTVVLWFVWKHFDKFSALRKLSLWHCTGLFLLSLLSFTTQGWCNKRLVRVFGPRLRLGEWFALTMAGSLASMAAMVSGMGMRALYLKRRHGLALSQFINCFAALSVTGLLVNSSILILVLLLALGSGRSVEPLLLGLAVFLSLAALVLMLVPWRLRWLEERHSLRWFLDLVEGWRLLSGHHRAMVALGLATTLRTVFLALIYYLVFHATGTHAGFLACLAAASFGTISRLVNLTPGALGIYEIAVIGSLQAFGLSPAEGMMVALIHRVVSTAVLAVFGIPSIFILMRSGKGEADVE